MTADSIVGKYLLVKSYTPIYDGAMNKIGSLRKGDVIGPVYSYIQRNGNVYWMFDYTIPGNTPGAFYVKHQKGAFDLSNDGVSSDSPDIPTFGGVLSESVVTASRANRTKVLMYLGLLIAAFWGLRKIVK